MIKKLLIFLIATMFLCGCSVKQKAEVVTFSSWGSISEVEIIKKAIYNFEKENPNIKINFMHIPQNYFQKIHLLFASNTAPDVIFINNLYLPIYASKLEDLSTIISAGDYYNQALKGMSYNGQILAIPRDISNQVFYVNTDMVKLPAYDLSMDELLNCAKKASVNGVYGLSYEDDIYWALPYIKYFGGEILNDKGELIINSQDSLKGIEFYKDLKNKYKVAPSKSQVGSSTLAQMFLDKKVAIYNSGRWMYPKISEKADFNWVVIHFPEGKSPQPCDTSGWAISKQSKHKDAAIKFVKYLSDDENIRYFTKTGLIVPAKIEPSKILDNDMHNEKAFLEAIKISETRNVNKDYKKLTDKINTDFDF